VAPQQEIKVHFGIIGINSFPGTGIFSEKLLWLSKVLIKKVFFLPIIKNWSLSNPLWPSFRSTRGSRMPFVILLPGDQTKGIEKSLRLMTNEWTCFGSRLKQIPCNDPVGHFVWWAGSRSNLLICLSIFLMFPFLVPFFTVSDGYSFSEVFCGIRLIFPRICLSVPLNVPLMHSSRSWHK